MRGAVEHLAIFGIVDKSLNVVPSLIDYKPQTFPFGFVSLALTHVRQYRSNPKWLATAFFGTLSFESKNP